MRNKTRNKMEKMINEVSYFQAILKMTFSDAFEAYDALIKFSGDIKYNIALNYLTLAQSGYIELKRVYFERELDHNELSSFFTAYEDYKIQFKKVITDKDDITSCLFGTHERLLEKWKSADEFLTNFLLNNQ